MRVTLTCGVLIAMMVAILMVRFLFGLGAVTALNDGYPWGIWVVVDVVIGSAFACGGFSVAMLVYIFNKGRIPPAGASGAAGQPVRLHPGRRRGDLRPRALVERLAHVQSLVLQSQFGDVRGGGLHHALHHRDVDRVLAGDPRAAGQGRAEEEGRRAMFFIIALGTVLPMMHQSSLGTLLVVLGVQIHPLWQTPMQPRSTC
jgi:Ni/Fe-hydrogenase subunit HybB-like protein